MHGGILLAQVKTIAGNCKQITGAPAMCNTLRKTIMEVWRPPRPRTASLQTAQLVARARGHAPLQGGCAGWRAQGCAPALQHYNSVILVLSGCNIGDPARHSFLSALGRPPRSSTTSRTPSAPRRTWRPQRKRRPSDVATTKGEPKNRHIMLPLVLRRLEDE
jgi:hypothetical protein